MTCDSNDQSELMCESEAIVGDLLEELCDKVVIDEFNNEAYINKRNNRKTCVIYDEFFELPSGYNTSRNRDSLYSLEEFDEDHDENDNRIKSGESQLEAVNEALLKKHAEDGKPKRKFSFASFFTKKKQPDNPPQTGETKKTLTTSKKYHSAIDVRHSSIDSSKLTRKPSLLRKKLMELQTDASKLIKRSLSLREIVKMREKERSREKLCELKTKEWARSYQSLIETDLAVKYDDLSFVNYDQFNDAVKYELPKSANSLKRTQSLYVNSDRKPVALSRGSSIQDRCDYAENYRNEESGAVSLPALNHILPENAEIPTAQKYRRRHPQSVCSDDGRCRPYANGSFRSAGSGCAKLKRHNACRQKSRGDHPLVSSITEPNRCTTPKNEQQTVRSRSLNHLDTLELRQGAASSTDASLKDSRSEPDCTKPQSATPGDANEAQPAQQPQVPPQQSAPSEVHSTRRHVLSRSQKSSSECFSVNFEVGDESTWETEMFFPATRSISLYESLSKICELRNINLASCEAWLQDRDSNECRSLLMTQDTGNLVGKHIRLTPKDSGTRKSSDSSGNNTRKTSASFRPRPTNSFFSSSTEDNSASTWSIHDADLAKKQVKPRWSGFWNKDNTKMESLTEQLDYYSKHGIPTDKVHKMYPQGQCESIDALYKLENDWRDVIDLKDLTERQVHQQTALWELIKTEVAYIKTLKVVTDLFLACLKNLQSGNILKEIDTVKLFSNITEILDANVLFWRNSLFPLVRDMRRFKQPPCLETMCEGFLKISDTFRAYFTYCAEQARCQHYCRENNAHNEIFTTYLAWCETQKECNRLKLMDILVQPMQRLTKYGLLLKAILKHTEDEVDRDNLNMMLKSVDDFVNSVNYSLKQRQDNERMNGIIARIESYDIVESKDDDLEKLLKSHSQLDLNKPMLSCPPERKRRLLLEGDLKLKESNTSKMEIHCFLLTDMLLVCKPSTKKGGATMRVIRQPYLVDRLIVTELTRETPSLAFVYKNELDMAVAAFILQNNDVKKLKSWKDGISKAQSLYAQAKQLSYSTEDALDVDYSLECNYEADLHSLQMPPRSPMATSSRASRVSSLAHSHSGSVEMNDQSSVGSAKDQSRLSMENENRTGSISSDEGVQPLPPDRSPVSQKNSFKHRLFHKTPNTLSVQPYANLGQSLPNLTLGSPNVGTLSLSLNQNTLSVPSTKNGGHLLSPTHRGISYPPPSPTRGNLRRGLAISQSKNPPLIKTRHVTSTTVGVGSTAIPQLPASFDFDVPVIAGVSSPELCENFSRGQHRQAMLKRIYRNDNKRYHTAGAVDDIKKSDSKDTSIHKRLSWNCTSQEGQQTSSNKPEEQI